MKASEGLRKGAWSTEEDTLLRSYIEKYGEGKWQVISKRSGLNRCRRSCRLRWVNYLKPNINRSKFEDDEVDLMMRLHKLLGNRWSLIAGRLPGRTANDVKNYWNTHSRKRRSQHEKSCSNQSVYVFRPRPRSFTECRTASASTVNEAKKNDDEVVQSTVPSLNAVDEISGYLESETSVKCDDVFSGGAIRDEFLGNVNYDDHNFGDLTVTEDEWNLIFQNI